jgi:hypothetical protein
VRSASASGTSSNPCHVDGGTTDMSRARCIARPAGATDQEASIQVVQVDAGQPHKGG